MTSKTTLARGRTSSWIEYRSFPSGTAYRFHSKDRCKSLRYSNHGRPKLRRSCNTSHPSAAKSDSWVTFHDGFGGMDIVRPKSIRKVHRCDGGGILPTEAFSSSASTRCQKTPSCTLKLLSSRDPHRLISSVAT